MNVQLIFDGCDSYALAENLHDAVLPAWPVQSSDSRWHHREFAGQRVVFTQRETHFGFLAEEVGEESRDEDGIFFVAGRFFRAISAPAFA